MRKPIIASLSLLVVFLLLLETVASAQSLAIAAEATPKVRRNEVRLGLMIGHNDVADADERGFGMHASIGRRHGDVTLMAEYQRISAGDDEDYWNPDFNPRVGSTSRVGGVLRYSMLTIGAEAPIGVDFWAEAGGGYERTSWEGGGVLSRPDVVLGFGLELDAKPGYKSAKPRHTGVYLAMRAHLARGPRPRGEETCGGPCDEATLPSRNDTSVFFHMGWHFGR
jgi:hypothetical protein